MQSISWLGVAFVLLGIALVVAPLAGRFVSLEDVPSWLIYVYRGDGFYFVTSPITILLSLVVFILHFLNLAQ